MESQLPRPHGTSRAATLWLLHSIAAIALAACSMSDVQGAHGNETDRLALLEFKAKIIVDPLSVLSSWSSSHHYCQWHGVTCGRRHQRVTILDLQSQELSGTISPHIGNLSFLRGYVPANLSSLSKLRELWMGDNGLSGEIPLSVGNFSSLEYLHLGNNKLRGTVPDTLGNLRNLIFLSLAKNNLVGNFPSSLTNISSMEALDLAINQLVGSLPLDLDITLPNLQFLSVMYNRFTGSIPKSISNMSQLNDFQITSNSFTGDVPSFRKMSNLLFLGIGSNYLGRGLANDLDFLCSLTNATNLYYLGIGNNSFGGEVPKCIGNLSIILDMFVLEGNALSGTMPSSIGNLINLEVLSVSLNNFSGSIPPEIGNLKKVKELYLAYNMFTGEVPHTLGNLSMLAHLSMSKNNLLGTIPSSLGKCQSLSFLDLADNKLAGAIPPEIMGLSSLSIYADFSMNNLTGELPVEIGNLKYLGELHLSGNKLSGKIPSSLGSCTSLEYLYMGDNMFTGPIPSTLSSLRGIKKLNLSHNRLSDQIPDFLEDLNLTSLDLSFNNFRGNLPTRGVFANTSATSVLGNEKLCGGLPEYRLPKCKSTGRSTNGRVRNASIYTVSGILAIAFMLSLLCFLWHRKYRKTVASSSSKDRCILIGAEYGEGAEVSTHGDVYSYGILMLEMFTGKRPTDDMFRDGLNLHLFAKAAFPERVLQIIDPVLLRESHDEDDGRDIRRTQRSHDRFLKIQECLVSIVEIGLVCSSEVPIGRMSMRDVAAALQAIRKKLTGS
ncbi:hypothetical protein CRG98_036911 [Punica granatum]|uniref:non-specific serine/threonine protein kinase n=1 Tax=Punica granatum TaxID=22663 RepID=A0A2I0IF57_PUNGR|nr:hypothetical protein CRG98_036911 [Punica granatum]